jgi:hypothetical protein
MGVDVGVCDGLRIERWGPFDGRSVVVVGKWATELAGLLVLRVFQPGWSTSTSQPERVFRRAR